MCYYVASHFSGKEIFQLEHDFVVHWEEEERASYYAVSGFAHPKLPVITSEGTFKNYRWGLIPSWVKDWESAKKIREQTLNAIGDTLTERPSYRHAVKAGRFCVIPVNGFFEWHHHINGENYPHYIYPKSESYFLLAGIYEQWINKELDEVFNTFTIITTPANPRMEWIHNTKKRMPAILTKEAAKMWLDGNIPLSEKKELLSPFSEQLMTDHSIGKLITSRRENPNQPAVSAKVEYPELRASSSS
ncbi:MAG: SOS response-associated peptidase [bacterium]|nr:SOS response-associated peptidase [bacterium]